MKVCVRSPLTLKYVELDKVIHVVYKDEREWAKAGYAQQKLKTYMQVIRSMGEPSVFRAVSHGFKVAQWINFKYHGVLQILALRRIGKTTYFKTCYGWATLNEEQPEFDHMKVLKRDKAKVTHEDVNFAASFALTGDLTRAFDENYSRWLQKGSRGPSKKKSCPHFLMSYQIPKSTNRLRP